MTSRALFGWLIAILVTMTAACSKDETAKSEAAEPSPPEASNEDSAEPIAEPMQRGAARTERPNPSEPRANPQKSVERARPMPAPEADLPSTQTQWLDKSEVRQAIGYQGLLEVDGVLGQSRSASYQSERLKTDDASQFGVGLQVWKGNNPPKRYDDLLAQSWGGVISKDVGDLSFRTEHHRLRELTFLDRKRNLVAILTCDAELCSFDQLVELGRRLQPRL